MSAKYYCEKCDYGCGYLSHWNQHINGKRHNDIKPKEREDKKLDPKCPDCDFTTNKNINMIVHRLNNHSTKEERQSKFKYYCPNCDFGVFSEILYKKHIETIRHKNNV